MRQILLSTSGAMLARVPRPAVASGSVLVKVHFSLVSTGTELAPLRATTPEGGAAVDPQSVKGMVRRAPELIEKAIHNPGLAWQRVKDISRRKAVTLKHRLLPPPPPAPVVAKPAAGVPAEALKLDAGTIGHVTWEKQSATELSSAGGRLDVRTNGQVSAYQAMSQPVAVPAGHVLRLSLKGRAKGAPFNLGVLSGDRQSWLLQSTLEDDFNETVLIAAPSDGFVWLAVFLSGPPSGAEAPSIAFEAIDLTLEARAADSPSLNEMNDLGWGVGYSAAGVVIAVGEGVRDLKVGDLVACGGAGQANHAEYICVKRNLVARVPDGCAADLAATCTVGAIALQGVRRAEPRLGETVCVVGLGLLGLLTCQMLKANGCRVLGLDPSEARVTRALKLKVDAAATSPERFLDMVAHATAGHGADATVITAATKSDALINQAMRTTRRKGRVVIVGDIGLAMERAELYRREIDVLISTSYGPGRYDPAYEVDGIDYPYAYVRWTQNRNMQAFLGLIASGAIDVRALIDEVVPLADAPAAYKRLANDTASSPVGVLIAYPDGNPDKAAPAADGLITLGGHRGPKPGRIGYVLVGAGAFGTSMLVPQMDKRKDRFDLRGVVSRDAVRGGNFARQRQLPILAASVGDVVGRDDIDLLVISTRHDQHAAQAAEALRAGKNVFVEKPLALTWDELDAVREAYAARSNGCLLMVGFNRRFAPAAEAMRQAITGRTGPLIINYRLNGGFIPRESWIQGREGGGRNLGEACHMYDFFRSLTGAPVATISATPIAPGDSAFLVNDNFVATLSYADGSLATLTYTANGPKSGLPKERVEVFCDGKAYLLDNYTSLIEYPSGTVLWSSDAGDKGHFEELSRFGDAIAAGADDGPIPFEEIAETTAVSLHIEDLLQGRL